MMKRRAFLAGTLGAVTAGSCNAQTATTTTQIAAIRSPPEPLVWPVVTKLQPGIRSFDGHTDTVPDVVGRIGTPPSLVIFTEGNHLMALLSADIVGAFPAWAWIGAMTAIGPARKPRDVRFCAAVGSIAEHQSRDAGRR
jgi:hypothetical protein